MAQATVNFRMDADVKQKMEQVCKEMGMSMTTAFTIFAATVGRERRIPFSITADPFYSEVNLNRLRNIVADLDAGKSVLTEHELMEE